MKVLGKKRAKKNEEEESPKCRGWEGGIPCKGHRPKKIEGDLPYPISRVRGVYNLQKLSSFIKAHFGIFILFFYKIAI